MIDYTIMLNFIENILCHFKSCFSLGAAFLWFVTITIESMLRSNRFNITYIIRDISFAPSY